MLLPPTTSSDRLETACQATGAMLSLAPFGRSPSLLVFSWSPSTGTFVQRLSSNTFPPGVYGFFAATFILLFALINAFPEMDRINQVFYVWVSVFSLLKFRSSGGFMADTYSKQQAKRLFGFIASGSSLGAIFGPNPSLFYLPVK
ncbi:MAG: hypothetical protein CM1200mP17_10160 [Woeseia sp.]|nr:MAG: hypothetical protein CM1200mP17_10160 [Woeseia sp.]